MYKPDLLKQYTIYLRLDRKISEKTIVIYKYEAAIFIDWAAPTGFENVKIAEYLSFRQSSKLFKPSYSNKIQLYIQSFYDFLLEEKIILRAPGVFFEKADPGVKLPVILNMVEYFTAIKTFDNSELGERNKAIVEVLFSSGLRISELLSIKTADFLGYNHKLIAKNNTERMYIVNDKAFEQVKRYLAVKKQPSVFLFTDKKGNVLTRNGVWRLIKEMRKRAGISKNISPHTFRHTFASILCEGGLNIFEVKDLMDHRSVSSTEIYMQLDRSNLRYELAKLNHINKKAR